jgi:hypothetical protein
MQGRFRFALGINISTIGQRIFAGPVRRYTPVVRYTAEQQARGVWNARFDGCKNLDCPQTKTCSNTYHRSAGNTSTSPETTFGAKTSVLSLANSGLCDHSRGLSVRFFPFRERIPVLIPGTVSLDTRSGRSNR